MTYIGLLLRKLLINLTSAMFYGFGGQPIEKHSGPEYRRGYYNISYIEAVNAISVDSSVALTFQMRHSMLHFPHEGLAPSSELAGFGLDSFLQGPPKSPGTPWRETVGIPFFATGSPMLFLTQVVLGSGSILVNQGVRWTSTILSPAGGSPCGIPVMHPHLVCHLNFSRYSARQSQGLQGG